jgi:hypothetical protein
MKFIIDQTKETLSLSIFVHNIISSIDQIENKIATNKKRFPTNSFLLFLVLEKIKNPKTKAIIAVGICEKYKS